jgi:peptidoglycan/xylan/chitin deacetylase (PgdA/CDA1 family)
MSAGGTLALSFDNLGEAAEIELGAVAADAPGAGRHFTVTRVLPDLLGRLEQAKLAATFFVEGLNAELYPEALREIAGRGHEVGYHAWRHEQWDGLPIAGQLENLERGLAAFADLGIDVRGMRPPGGQLGEGGLRILSGAGLRYCSPAGRGAGVEGGLAVLPFEWRHVDASCVLPPLGPVREQIAGSPEPIQPDRFRAYLEAEIGRVAADGGLLVVVLHLFMLEWLGDSNLNALLDHASAAVRGGEIEALTFADLAERLAGPDLDFPPPALDETSWA